MLAIISKYISSIKKTIGPLASLIGSGLVGALCLTAMTAGDLSSVSGETAAKLAIFISYQTLGLTIVKAGLDGYVFAKSSTGESNNLFDLSGAFKKKIITSSLAFGIFSMFYMDDFYVVTVCVLSVIFDAYSAIRLAEYASLRRFKIVAIGGVLKYPFYFATVFLFGLFERLEFYFILNIFIAVLFLRSFFIYLVSKPLVSVALPSYSMLILGFQQVLNYILFRVDQLSIPIFSKNITTFDEEYLRIFVGLTKYPELVSYLATTLGVVVFPRVLQHWNTNNADSKLEKIAINCFIFVACAIGLYLYIAWFNFRTIDITILVALLMSSAMSFPVNYLTYRMLFLNELSWLNISLAFSLAPGAMFIFLIYVFKLPNLLYWAVPLQMIAFLIMQLYFYHRKELVKIFISNTNGR